LDYDKETIKNAPRIEADDDLTPREELELFRYYSRSAGRDTSNRDVVLDRDRDRFARDDDRRDWNDTADPTARRAADPQAGEERVVDEPRRGRLRRYIGL
jgi:hypothetical protein